MRNTLSPLPAGDDMTVRIAINGFGRIGRLALRAGLQRSDLQFVAINDLNEPDLLHYLFGSDSLHGHFKGELARDGGHLVVNGQRIPLLRQKDPAMLPWKELGVDCL